MAKRAHRKAPDVIRLADASKCTHTTILNSGLRYNVQVISADDAIWHCILFHNGEPLAKTRWIPRVRIKPMPRTGTTEAEGEL